MHYSVQGKPTIFKYYGDLQQIFGVSEFLLLICFFSGYVFWSLFQGLAPMIWFYPLNELEISGYEAFAVLWFLPVFTGKSQLHSRIKHISKCWSLFQGLVPMIWFCPLNELGISGYEAFAILWFMPVFTGQTQLCLQVKHKKSIPFNKLTKVLFINCNCSDSWMMFEKYLVPIRIDDRN